MPPDPPPSTDLLHLDPGFFGRVYRTSTVALLLLALLGWGRFGTPAVLGWLLGGALCLAMLWSVEYSVRRYINPESQSAGGLVGLSLLKFLIVAGVLILAYLAARRGWLRLVWVLPGFTLPYVIVGLKVLGRKLLSATRTGPRPRQGGVDGAGEAGGPSRTES